MYKNESILLNYKVKIQRFLAVLLLVAVVFGGDKYIKLITHSLKVSGGIGLLVAM